MRPLSVRSRATSPAGWVLALGVALGGCGAGLSHGLDERQANEVVAALDRAGIAADKAPDETQGRWKVTVAHGELGRAAAALEAGGLPRPSPAVAGGGLLPSAAAERAGREAALGAELGRTIEHLPGIAFARVHLALPADDPLRGDLTHPRATASVVLLRSADGAGPTETEVKRLVAAAVEGLQAEDVTVRMDRVALLPSARLATVGPIEVAPGSRGTALALGSVALGLILTLAVVVALLAVRIGTLRRRLDELEGGQKT